MDPDPLSPSGSAHGTGQCIHLLRYTENPFYSAHRLLYVTLHTLYRMRKFLINKTFFPEFHSGLIWIQTVFANVNRERKRERLVHALPFRKIKVHRQIDKKREREREREVVFLNFVIFLTLRTRLRISKLRVYLCKKF